MTQVGELIDNSISVLKNYPDISNLDSSIPRRSVHEKNLLRALVSETPNNGRVLFADLFCGMGDKFTSYIAEEKRGSKVMGFDGFGAYRPDGRLKDGSDEPGLLTNARMSAAQKKLSNLELRCEYLREDSDLGINPLEFGTKIFTGFRTVCEEAAVAKLANRYDASIIVNVPSRGELFGSRSDKFISNYMMSKGNDILSFVKDECARNDNERPNNGVLKGDILASDISKQIVLLDRAKFLEEKCYNVQVFGFVDAELGIRSPHSYNRLMYAFKKDNVLKL